MNPATKLAIWTGLGDFGERRCVSVVVVARLLTISLKLHHLNEPWARRNGTNFRLPAQCIIVKTDETQYVTLQTCLGKGDTMFLPIPAG